MITRQLLDGLGEPVDELPFSMNPDLPERRQGTEPDTAQSHHGGQALQQRRPNIIDRVEPISRRQRRPAAGSKIVANEPGGSEHHTRDEQKTHHDDDRGRQDSETLHTRSMAAPPRRNNRLLTPCLWKRRRPRRRRRRLRHCASTSATQSSSRPSLLCCCGRADEVPSTRGVEETSCGKLLTHCPWKRRKPQRRRRHFRRCEWTSAIQTSSRPSFLGRPSDELD
jgi:hypothetical protein